MGETVNSSVKNHEEPSKGVSSLASVTSHYLFQSTPKEMINQDILKVVHLDCFHNKDQVTQSAINLLKTIGSEKSFKYLFAIIKDYPEARKLWALDALYSIGNAEVIPPLLDYFKVSFDEEIKCAVLKVLAKFSKENNDIKELILAHTKDELGDSPLRFSAIEALGDLEETDILKDIIQSPNENIVIAGIMSLSKIKNIDSLHLIKRLCTQFNSLAMNVQIALIKALVNLENDHVLELIRVIFLEKNEDKIKQVLNIIEESVFLRKYPIRITKTFLRMSNFSDRLDEKVISTFTSYYGSFPEVSQKISTEISDSIENILRNYFAKFKKNYENEYKTNLSLKTQIEKDLFLAKEFLEKFANEAFVQMISNFLKKEDYNPQNKKYIELNATIAKSAKKVRGDYFQNIKSLLRLLESKDKLERTRVAAYLNTVDFKKKHDVNRLQRLLTFVSITKSQKNADIAYEIFRWGLQLQDRKLMNIAMIALGRSGHKALIREAQKTIFPKKDSILSRTALLALGELGRKEAVPVIVEYFTSIEYNEDIYLAIINAFDKIGAENDKSVLETLLTIFLKSPSDTVRYNSAMTFAKLASSNMVPTLAKYKDSKVDKIRELLALMIGKLYEGNEASGKEMIQNFFYSMLKDPSLYVKINSVLMLYRMGDDYSLEVLKDMFQTQDMQVLSDIIIKTVEIDSIDKIYWLVRLLEKDNESLHRSVSLALISLLEGGSKHKKTIVDLVKDFRLKPFADKKIDEIDSIKATQMDLSKAQEKEKFQFEREQTKELTILFIDIAGYTKKSSTMDLMEIMNYLKSYEEIAIPIFTSHFGTVVKKMGDGLMLSFPLAIYGSLAAIRLQEKLHTYNQFKPDKEKIICRVGLNTGPVAVQGQDLFGDAVNVASRMETKANLGGVLVSESTFLQVKDYLSYEDMGGILVKGKDEPIHSYHLLSISASLPVDLDPLKSGDSALKKTEGIVQRNEKAEIEKIKTLIAFDEESTKNNLSKKLLLNYRLMYKNVLDITDSETKEKISTLLVGQWQELKGSFFNPSPPNK